MSEKSRVSGKMGADIDRGGVAVIGIGCWYPGARDPRQFWESILARRKEFRKLPDQRFPLRDYHSTDPSLTDLSYLKRAAVIDGFIFDWAAHRIPKGTFESTDVAQWLALEVAGQAIKDAGLSRETLPGEKTGVFVGNSLTGEQTRTNYMRMRWPAVKRALLASLASRDVPEDVARQLTEAMEDHYKSLFPEVTEDTLAGALPSSIPGRICNFFDLKGGGVSVDAACASSLIAAYHACCGLDSGALDLAIAGGVDISLDPLELVGFARVGALSKNEIRPFDRRGTGFLPGEGSGFVVLKRLADALRDGDFVYAVIRGWGMSSDGRSGFMQPTVHGQRLAMKRAYARAGYEISRLRFFEAHGTGTTVGDRVELDGISGLMTAADPTMLRNCGVGSLKSIIGHTKAAAGIGSLIKTVIALNRRVMPPTASCEQPHPIFDDQARQFFPIQYGEKLEDDVPVFAGVSSYGFGGLNCHLTLESGPTVSEKLRPDLDERALMVSNDDAEVFVFSDDSAEKFLQRADALIREAERLSWAELVDFAAKLGSEVDFSKPFRAVIVADSAEKLAERLEFLKSRLSGGDSQSWWSDELDIWVGRAGSAPVVGFVFPGQGSQELNMGRTLIERFPWARKLLERADQLTSESCGIPLSLRMLRPLDRTQDRVQLDLWKKELAQTQVAQPAICLTSVIYAKFLAQLGVAPSVVGGHSLGELTALYVAGAFDEESLLRVAARRGRVMAQKVGASAGAMASLGCSRSEAENLLKSVPGYLTVANLNSPKQTVVSGDAEAVSALEEKAKSAGILCHRLPVSNAFHSKMMEPAARELLESGVIPAVSGSLKCRVISGVDGKPLGGELALGRHLSGQILEPVNFIGLAESLRSDCDVILEVGPGRILSNLLKNGPATGGALCLSIASQAGSQADLKIALAALFTRGVDIRWDALYANRLIRPYVEFSKKIFISSSTENEFKPKLAARRVGLASSSPAAPEWLRSLSEKAGVAPAALVDYLRAREGFLGAVIRADLQSVEEREESLPMRRVANGYGDSFEPKPEVSKPAPIISMVRPEAATPGKDLAGDRAGDGAAVLSVLAGAISKRTGYSLEMIKPESKLLDDLNIDSIKAGEIVASVSKEFGAIGKVDPAGFANATLQAISSAIAKATGAGAGHAQAEQRPSVAAEAPATPVAGTTETSVIDRIMELIAKRTGYSREMIKPESKLLDDLNIDSIKAGEIVASVSKEFGAIGKVDPAGFANATIRQIAQSIQRAMGPHEEISAPAEVQHLEPGADPQDSLVEKIRSAVAKRTGFPLETIQPSSKLLDDLNIDSIKTGELVAMISREEGVLGKVDPARFANSTLLDVAKAIQSAKGAMPSAPKGSQQSQPASDVSLTREAVLEALQEAGSRITGYSREILNPDAHLTFDLGLSQEKIRNLIESAAGVLGIRPTLDLGPITRRNLGEIASILQDMHKAQRGGHPLLQTWRQAGLDRSLEDSPSWVRNFSIEILPEPRSVPKEHRSRRVEDDLTQSYFLLLADATDDDFVSGVVAGLLEKGAKVRVATYQENRTQGLSHQKEYSHMVAILPRSSRQEGDDEDRLRRMLDRLLSVALPPMADTVPRRRTTVCYVQFGGGYFGAGATSVDPELCCASSFARALHLERPDLRVRALDFSETMSAPTATEWMLGEICTPQAFIAAGYAPDGVRRVQKAVVQEPSKYRPRPLQWSPSDVILVTGGGKGITPEMALGLAADGNRAKFAFVGSSPLPDRSSPDYAKSELVRNLERYRAAGMEFRYYACDIADRGQVNETVARIRADLGAVTGVIHGGAILAPRRLEHLDLDRAVKDAGPKVLGAMNIARALQDSPPKFFLGMTSVLGILGGAGTSVYSFSNETLDVFLRGLGMRQPDTIVQSLGWGTWGETGGSLRVGAFENLKRIGNHLGSISTAEGVRRFVEIFNRDPGSRHVVSTGRVVGFDTWDLQRDRPAENDDFRFLENVLRFEPGIELVVRAHLTLERDVFLKDHVLRGTYIVPFVMSLEAAAQASLRLVGRPGQSVIRAEAIDLLRPITVDRAAGEIIEIRAEALEEPIQGGIQVKVAIRSSSSDFTQDCFRGTLVVGPAAKGERTDTSELQNAPLSVDPRGDYYSRPWWVTGPYQRLKAVYALDPERSTALLEASERAARGQRVFLDATSDRCLALGDPYLRDAMLHCSALSQPQCVIVPRRIERIDFFRDDSDPGNTRVSVSSMTRRNVNEFTCDVICAGMTGNIVEKVTGITLHAMETHPEWPTAEVLKNRGSSPEAALREAIRKASMKLGLTVPELALGSFFNLGTVAKEERHRVELALVRQAARAFLSGAAESMGAPNGDPLVAWNDSGKPRFTETLSSKGLDLSMSHDESFCLCVVGEGPQGCDIEIIPAKTAEEWIGMLGERHRDLMDALVGGGDTVEQAGTRIWSAMESVGKVVNHTDFRLEFMRRNEDAVALKTMIAGRELVVLTLLPTLADGRPRVVAFLAGADTGAKHLSVEGGRGQDQEKFRYLEKVEVNRQTGELMVRTRLSLDRDLYLKHHRVNGLHVMPTVFLLEAAAQAATRLITELKGAPMSAIVAAEHVSLPWPIVVDSEKGLEIEIRAKLLSDGDGPKIKVGILSEATSFSQEYFAATVCFGKRSAGSAVSGLDPKSFRLSVDPAQYYYGKAWYVEGPFQRIKRIFSINSEFSMALAESVPEPDRGKGIFDPSLGETLVLGDMFLRDSLLHSSVISQPRISILTKRFERFEFFEANGKETERYLVSKLQAREDGEFDADLLLLDGSARILERVNGFRLKAIRMNPKLPSVEEILSPVSVSIPWVA